MAHRKTHRRTHRKRSSRNMASSVVKKSVGMVKSTSKRYMPKVKSGLENVGSKVITKGEKSIPYLQKKTRGFFNMISSKTKKIR